VVVEPHMYQECASAGVDMTNVYTYTPAEASRCVTRVELRAAAGMLACNRKLQSALAATWEAMLMLTRGQHSMCVCAAAVGPPPLLTHHLCDITHHH
jgi:hypothetical protein